MHPTRKRSLIDVSALREAYRSGDLSNIAWISSKHNISDGLSKSVNYSSLDRVLKILIIKTPIHSKLNLANTKF